MKNKLPDFTKKVVSLGFPGTDEKIAIEHPRWQTQGGRLFLVGKFPHGSSKDGWLDGLDYAAAWDQISEYLVFETADDYRKRLQIFRARKRKS